MRKLAFLISAVATMVPFGGPAEAGGRQEATAHIPAGLLTPPEIIETTTRAVAALKSE